MIYVLFHKPYGVVSQFSGEAKCLREFVPLRDVYPVGRLDTDSEGLMLLTDDGWLQHRLTDPRFGHPRTYWAQVEGIAGEDAVRQLEAGVVIQGNRTLPAKASLIEPAPVVPDRDPPIRYRASIPISWIELRLTEGRNRQVRRMTAAVGLPTLRLIRVAIGYLKLEGLGVGEYRKLTSGEAQKLIAYARALSSR